jgi:hypothetical protein
MPFNVNEMKAKLRFGGARPTQFMVQIHNPIVTGVDTVTPYMVQAASIPPLSVGTIQVPFFGRLLPLPGDRQFQPWQVDVINDEDFAVRHAFEAWNTKINSLEGNVRDLPTSQAAEYTSTATVTQFSKTGKPLRTYEFVNVYPAEIGEIQLSWGATDQIETFPVTFMYDYFRPTGLTVTPGISV